MADQVQGSGNDQSGAGASAGGTSQPEYLTEDKARGIIAGVVKSMLTKELPVAIGSSLKTSLEAELTPLKQMFAELAKAKEQPTGDDDKTKKPKGDNGAPPPDPRIVELEKQLQKVQEDSRKANERAAQERRRNHELAAFGSLRGALNGKVRAEAVDIVEAMVRGRNLLNIDEDGNATMKVKIRQSKDSPEEEETLPIEDAIGHWLKSKEAALFIPPQTQTTPAKRTAPAANAQSRTGNGQFANAQPDDPRAILEGKLGPLNNLFT
jgi:hypothetical protein